MKNNQRKKESLIIKVAVSLFTFSSLVGCVQISDEATESTVGTSTEIISDDSTTVSETFNEQVTEITTENTYGFNNPAPIGVAQTVNTSDLSGDYTAEIKIMSTVRGQEALNIIMEENSLNEAPEDGYEYILARVNFKNVKCGEGKSVSINPLEFAAFTADGVEYDTLSSFGTVTPDELRGELYQGAEKEGYLLFVTKIGDSPKVSYGTSYDGTGGIWFKLD